MIVRRVGKYEKVASPLAQALFGDAQYENGHIIAGIILLEV